MCETAAAAYHRHDSSDHVWNILAPLLPGGPGKVGRSAQDNRHFINAVFWGTPHRRPLARSAAGLRRRLRRASPVQPLAPERRLGLTAGSGD